MVMNNSWKKPSHPGPEMGQKCCTMTLTTGSFRVFKFKVNTRALLRVKMIVSLRGQSEGRVVAASILLPGEGRSMEAATMITPRNNMTLTAPLRRQATRHVVGLGF